MVFSSSEDADLLLFSEEEEEIASSSFSSPSWKVMLVDDDAAIHQSIQVALRSFRFEERKLEFISAYSGQEALNLIGEHPDTALIFLDVIMETQDAGLKVVEQIRSEQKNNSVRIILITGQPGQAPEESIIVNYDINDYKTKLELTQQKLFTTLVSSLRTHRDIATLEQNRLELASLNAQLATLNETLEEQVQNRTRKLEQNNEKLKHEIAERERAEQSQRLYLHALTHDLRNPVTGMVNILSSFLNQPAPYQESVSIPLPVLERMQKGCEHQRQMIDRLLEADDINLTGILLQRSPFDMASLIQAVVAEWKPALVKKRIRLSLNISTDLPLVDGDYYQLWRVFANLIENSLKYNPPEIQLTITVSLEGSGGESEGALIYCSIMDDGIGIRQEQLTKVFDLYHRACDVSISPGLGLGLYICRSIVQAHGGTIGVESQLGQGADFWFTLPLVSPSQDS